MRKPSKYMTTKNELSSAVTVPTMALGTLLKELSLAALYLKYCDGFYHILWLLRIFPCIKRIVIFIRGQRKPTTVRQSNVSRLATSILPYSKQGKNGDTKYVQQLVFYIGSIGALGTPRSCGRGSDWQYDVVQSSICVSGYHGQAFS
jgi:hypothetical protein